MTRVDPVLAADGTSLKSPVPASAVAAGFGHLCPYELWVFIEGTCKKDRVAAGFTKHRGFLHVYFRAPGSRASRYSAKVFAEACRRFDAMAVAAAQPPVMAAAAQPPVMAAAAQLPAGAVRCIKAFAGDEWGDDYLRLSPGDVVLPLPPPEDDYGWAYGRLEGADNPRRSGSSLGARGWYPATFMV